MRAANHPNRTFLLTALGVVLCLVIARAGDPDASRSAVSVGQKAPSFRAATMDFKPVNFPNDYKGRVVLLDFWATWCPPCRAELPGLVATYGQYHDKGFDVLGVSLDQSMQRAALLQFIKANNIAWPQIYDGGAWDAEVAVKYGVHAIPCPVLVDGDTGMILAADTGALGQNLAGAVRSALAAKAKK
jgi:thiol-disulfide isomerase/thioredoxin